MEIWLYFIQYRFQKTLENQNKQNIPIKFVSFKNFIKTVKFQIYVIFIIATVSSELNLFGIVRKILFSCHLQTWKTKQKQRLKEKQVATEWTHTKF